MPETTHLRSLQALEAAVRAGSLKAAGAKLGITPAAVGQRIRALENYLGTTLLVAGRSGLRPTAQLVPALGDLHAAFALLMRATEALDLQRVGEIWITADPDWAEFWLLPRLAAFREVHPSIRFCINETNNHPGRSRAPDISVLCGGGQDEPLFTDILIPLSGPDNLRRLIAKGRRTLLMEGMPLLHLKAQLDDANHPGWVAWFQKFGDRESGQDRGVRYQQMRLALDAVRTEVGFLVCGLSLVREDLGQGLVFNLFPLAQHLVAPHPYRLKLRKEAEQRPQVQKFLTWLRKEAGETRRYIETLTR